VGSDRAALIGLSEGGPMSVLFAATYPERTSALIMIGSYARRVWAPNPEESERVLEQIEHAWGGPVGLEAWAPSLAGDQWFRQWWATYLRTSASPAAALVLTRMNYEIDVRQVLPVIAIPTLIIHRTGDRAIPIEDGRYLAEHIRSARFVELPGDDHLPWVGNQDAILDAIEGFLTGTPHTPDLDTVLTTVLFTDIAGSTEKASELGDRRWKELLEAHYALVLQELGRYRGREVNTMGDGFLATFDGPARAIRCACAISTAVRRLGIQVRAGVHTGEIRLAGGQVGGIAVHIGARIAALATAGEVLVSSTVKDLVAGSGIQFEDCGMHRLKGIQEEWHLYRVAYTVEAPADSRSSWP
jgi:class 3 adenylate cyclase